MSIINRVAIEELGEQIGQENLTPLFEIFTTELADYQQTLSQCEASKTSKQLAEICHALKSSAASFGADALCEHAREMDRLYKLGTDLTSGDYVNQTNAMLAETERAYTDYIVNKGARRR
ncbi:Hpt domain-containing protein [Vibrio sp. WXL210]|uniref:Hpt domain-containing protein n=1 Tax=Vibrio sp. WXL210 TaxID=3450709 RepID=UPI003EC4E254